MFINTWTLPMMGVCLSIVLVGGLASRPFFLYFSINIPFVREKEQILNLKFII